ncbi:unnamed protein product [Ilex paraguariensis]|uniref:Pentatricopeptide repeat-containing protein n=1 Tax=Ilex paraguariensis TaxID=185542 RepID=A0ABC8U7X8_9AQUA
MMKLIHSNSWCKCRNLSRVFRVCLFSTNSPIEPSRTEDTLFRRLLPASDPKVSVVPILDRWLVEGKPIEQEELQKIIKQLRNFRRFKDALEISKWMSDIEYLDISAGDVAVQLDLISKVHGLEQAEVYFDNIPNTLRVFQVYGALLNSYAEAKSLEKAEIIMQKMRELGYARTLSYNVMLNLYSEMGKHDKIDFLMQEMEEKGITCDKYTFNIRLNAYAANSDIEGMEKLLRKMEADPFVIMDWNAYVVAANGFLKAGVAEKALAVLKKAEQLIKVKTRRSAYEILLTLYASMGKKDKVYHIWNLHKKIGKFYNISYLCMISSLVKLDDLEGAEKVLEEWEAKKKYFDLRVPNLLISAYCKKGLLGKAESIVNRLTECGKEPDASTWSRMALGYQRHNQMEKAVETMKKSILASHPGWKPNLPTLASCLEYLKGKGDVEGAEDIMRLLEKKGHFSEDLHDRIIKYIKKGNPVFQMLE